MEFPATLRANQCDALVLDKDLVQLLTTEFKRIWPDVPNNDVEGRDTLDEAVDASTTRITAPPSATSSSSSTTPASTNPNSSIRNGASEESILQRCKRTINLTRRYLATTSSYLEKVNPDDVELSLQSVIFYFTVFRNIPTPGMKLQNIKLTNLHVSPLSLKQKIFFYACQVLLPYLSSKLYSHMLLENWAAPNRTQSAQSYVNNNAENDNGEVGNEVALISNNQTNSHRLRLGYSWRQICYHVLQRCIFLHSLISYIHFCIFLYNGRYPTLVMRLLRIRFAYIQPNAARQLSFEFMNQSLAWSTLSSFSQFFFPFISSVLQTISRLFGRLSEIATTEQDSNESRSSETLTSFANSSPPCSICDRAKATIPYIGSCGCIYCYYCISARRLARGLAHDINFRCPTCSEVSHTTSRLSAETMFPSPTK